MEFSARYYHSPRNSRTGQCNVENPIFVDSCTGELYEVSVRAPPYVCSVAHYLAYRSTGFTLSNTRRECHKHKQKQTEAESDPSFETRQHLCSVHDFTSQKLCAKFDSFNDFWWIPVNIHGIYDDFCVIAGLVPGVQHFIGRSDVIGGLLLTMQAQVHGNSGPTHA